MARRKNNWFQIGGFAIAGLVAFDFLRKSLGVTAIAEQLGARDNKVLAEPISADVFKVRDKLLSSSELAKLVANDQLPITTVEFVYFSDQEEKKEFAEKIAERLRVLRFNIIQNELLRIDANIASTLSNLSLVEKAIRAFQGEIKFFVLRDTIFVEGINATGSNVLIRISPITAKLILSDFSGLVTKAILIVTPTSSNEVIRQMQKEFSEGNLNILVVQEMVQDNIIPFNFDLLR